MDIERTIEGGSGMNEIIRAMEERRSVRKFKPDMVPKEMIEQIVCSKRNGKAGGDCGCCHEEGTS